MSSWGGHQRITMQAVKEITTSCSNHSLGRNLSAAHLPHYVTMRDFFDAINQGHWADFGQPHHFMRKFDGQSPHEAYLDGVKWIESNALMSARQMASRIQFINRLYRHSDSKASINSALRSSCKAPDYFTGKNKFQKGRLVLGGGDSTHNTVGWQTFGNALHSLQDSFSYGHAVRDKSLSEYKAGAITHVKIYAGHEQEGHKDFDDQWGDEDTDTFSTIGRHAINASKDLIHCILETAVNTSAGKMSSHIAGWGNFQNKWLIASPKLSIKRDFVIDFIERFHTGAHRGGWNIITVNMDEAGMADALIKECGTNSVQVYNVFKHLYENYQSDVDDIAELYVDHLRKSAHAITAQAIKNNKTLSALLAKAMDEGYTSDNEQACIDFITE